MKKNKIKKKSVQTATTERNWVVSLFCSHWQKSCERSSETTREYQEFFFFFNSIVGEARVK